MSLSPAERSLAGRIGAFALHSQYDSRELTKPARSAWERRFEDQVDPERVLPEAERRRRADSAKKAYMLGLALKSAKARKRAAP